MHLILMSRRRRLKSIGFSFFLGNDSACPRPRPRTSVMDGGTRVGCSQRLCVWLLNGRNTSSTVLFSRILTTLLLSEREGSTVKPKLVRQ